MKVLLLSAGFVEYMVELSNGLCRNENVKVYLLMPEGKVHRKYLEYLDKRVVFLTFNLIDYISVRDISRMVIDLRKTINRICPDIFHLQSDGFRFIWLTLLLTKKKFKLINTIHDPALHIGDRSSKRYLFNEKITRRYTDHFLVHGEFLKKELSEISKISSEKISVVMHGNFNIYKIWRESDIKKRPNSFLFFGRIWKYKGLEVFLHASEIILQNHPEAIFIIAGTGENIDHHIKEYGEKKSYIFKNYRLAEKEVDELFQFSTFVVLPYIEATQSGVIPIALSYGSVVIATRVGSIPEVIKDNSNGYLVEPKNKEALAAIMIKAMSNKRNAEIVLEGHKTANSLLSWSSIAVKTYDVYTNLCC